MTTRFMVAGDCTRVPVSLSVRDLAAVSGGYPHVIVANYGGLERVLCGTAARRDAIDLAEIVGLALKIPVFVTEAGATLSR